MCDDAKARQEDVVRDDTIRLVSFDVGIRHLAYCVLRAMKPANPETNSIKDSIKAAAIERWEVIDLQKVTSVDACCKKLVEELHERFKFEAFDVVLIERQPKNRSVMMAAIQMFLCTYFNVSRIVQEPRPRGTVKFMHARRKLLCCHNTLPDDTIAKAEKSMSKLEKQRAKAARYRDNKKRAIESCLIYLNDVLQDAANATFLGKFKKKDDLADSFLQAIAYLEEAYAKV